MALVPSSCRRLWEGRASRLPKSRTSTSAAPIRLARTTATWHACRFCSPAFRSRWGGATVNRLCGSGLEAVANAARAVMLGEANVYIGGGVESMSRAPYALPKPEKGFATGHQTVYDTTLGWRFVNPRMEEMGYTDSLGMTAENLAQERFQLTPEEQRPEEVVGVYDISRESQDRFALRSHEKAVVAQDTKRFCDEIV